MRARRRRPTRMLAALVVVASLAGACSAEPAVSSPSPTPNPNELARQSRSPGPTPATSAAATAAPGSSQPTDSSTSAAPATDVLPTATPFAPDLEDLLPSALRGHGLQRFSFPGAAVGATGDMCSYVCPGEPHALAAALGVDVDQVDLAIAGADDTAADVPRVVIVAYRVRGAATDRLIPARLESMHREGLPDMTSELTVAGKPITWASYGAFPSATTMEYLYADGDVLFRIIDGIEPAAGAATPPDTVLAIEALP